MGFEDRNLCWNIHLLIADYTAGFGGKHAVQKEEPARVAPVAAPKPAPGRIRKEIELDAVLFLIQSPKW